MHRMIEAVVQRCSLKQVEACNFIKKEALAQVFSCEFCEISKNTFLHRTPLVAASGMICIAKRKPVAMCIKTLKPDFQRNDYFRILYIFKES